MSLLGTKIPVLSRGASHEFIGVSSNEDQMIITYADNITVFNISQRKMTDSWTAGQGQLITSPAIYNAVDDEFVAIINSNIIKTFNCHFHKGEKFTVNSPIHRIAGTKPSMVIFKNGTVMPLSEVLSDPGQTPPTGPVPPSASTMQFINTESPCFLICHNKSHYLMMAKSPKVKLCFGSSDLLCACHQVVDEGFILATLWGDGSLCMSRVTEASMMEGKVEMRKVAHMSLPQDGPGSEVLALLNEKLVAVAGKTGQIRVVDVKYGVMHECIQEQEILQATTLARHLVVASRGSIFMYNFSSFPVALSSVVGKNPSLGPELPQSGTWDKPLKQKRPKGTDDVTNMKVLLESHALSKLEAAWAGLWSSKTPSARHTIASSSFMRRFLRRLMDSKEEWGAPLMRTAMSDGIISVRMCDGMITEIVAREDWRLLADCLTKMRDISEEEAVHCLNAVLPSGAGRIPPFAGEIISSCTNLPLSEERLVDALRWMELDKSMVLLSHLGSRLKETRVDSATDVNKVLTWVCLILDAHFPQIIVNSSAWERLLKVRRIISTQVELYDRLWDVDVILSKMKEAARGSKIRNSFSYKIQTMTF